MYELELIYGVFYGRIAIVQLTGDKSVHWSLSVVLGEKLVHPGHIFSVVDGRFGHVLDVNSESMMTQRFSALH